MTTERNALAQYRNDYLDYLEGERDDQPSLDALDPSDQARASAWMDSLEAARGVDPYASRPSVSELLERINTSQKIEGVDPVDALGETIETHLKTTTDPASLVVADPAAQAAGLGSSLVIHARGLRMRVLVEPEGADLDRWYHQRVPALAAIFGGFPDTTAVLYVGLSTEATGVVVDSDDVRTAIETPGGSQEPPRIRRPVAPATEACEAYLREVLPSFAPVGGVSASGVEAAEFVDVEQIVAQAIGAVAEAGRRAQTPEKKETWTALTPADTQALVALANDARSDTLSEDGYARSLEHIVRSAA